MLSKCANPSCSAEFRYLHQGKLFLLKSKGNDPQVSARVDFAGKIDHLHYAWLCDKCARTHEVVLDLCEQVKVQTRPKLYGCYLAAAGSILVQLLQALCSPNDPCGLLG